MRAPILAAGLVATAMATALSCGAARADEPDVPGASRSGPTFQRPVADNPEMRAYITEAPPASATAPGSNRPAVAAQQGR